MDLELQPTTDAGRAFVALAEEHARDAASVATKHDQEGSFPFETFEAMKATGFLAAPVPAEFGGGGLTSVFDLAVGLNRLARTDASTAIAANMHLTFGLITARLLRAAKEAEDDDAVTATTGFLTLLGSGSIAMANATEGGTDLLHPLTTVTEAAGGWAVNGHKIFGTLSPIADIFFVPARRLRPDGSYEAGFALAFRGMDGLNIKDNWDALGMRASGSNDVLYEDCVVPPELYLSQGADWGAHTIDNLIIATAGNIGLVAASLGIAEAAQEAALGAATTRRKAPSGRLIGERHGIQRLIGENDIDLTTCRALLEGVGRVIDEVVVDRPPADVGVDDLHQVNRQFQAAKAVVNRKAIEIVDRALTISGGAGFLTANPLSRMYRDVRAGPFMQPFSPVEVHEYVAKVAMGFEPVIET